MKIIPINNHILVEVKKIEEAKTESGIILATDENVRSECGEVVAIDSSLENIKVGDKVYFKLYSVSTIEIDGKEFHFIKIDDVLGLEK